MIYTLRINITKYLFLVIYTETFKPSQQRP